MKFNPAWFALFVVLTISTQTVTAQGGPDLTYIADLTVPDDTVMQPGEQFTKTWRVQNSGSTDWNENCDILFVECIWTFATDGEFS